MLDLLEGVEPRSRATCVAGYLRDVRTIDSLTPRDADDEAMDALRAVMTCIQRGSWHHRSHHTATLHALVDIENPT